MSDNFKIIKCPACQNEMVKVFIPSEGINLDICLNGCGGIYFDNQEYKHFDEQDENIDEIIEAIKDKVFIEVDENLPRTCPACGARMVKNFSSIKKEIQIEECYSCGGKFLDNNELLKIREEFATEKERSDEMMSFVYQTIGPELKEAQMARDAARAKRSLLRKLFDKLFDLN